MPGSTSLKTDSQKASCMQSWHASQMPFPLPHPTDSGEETCDRAGVLRQPYNPWSQLTGKQAWQKAAGKHHCYQKTGSAEPPSREGHRCPAPLASDRVLVLLGTGTSCSGSKHAPRQREHTSEACLCLPRLPLYNSRNQKPQQTMSSSLARDHITGQEGRRHFDQAGIALNSFHTDISATGISTPTPQTSCS